MNAEQLDFSDQTFDIAFCSFVVFFFPHPDRALAEIHRVLKPGGKIAISTWGKGDPRWVWLSDLIKQFSRGQQQSQAPSLNTSESLVATLQQAGFRNVEIPERSLEVYYTSADEWWQTRWTQGARVIFEQIPAETLNRDAPLRFRI